MKYVFRSNNERLCYDVGYWEGYKAALSNVKGHASEAGASISRRVKKIEERLIGGV